MIRHLIFAAVVLITLSSVTFADQQFSLVTPEWVAEHANDDNVLILDVRADPYDYFSGHVPNAVHLGDNTMRGPKDGVPVQYLPVAQTAELIKRAGVKNDQTLIVYSDGPSVLGATMFAYILERMGHSDVKLMDGGWTAYKASQKPSQSYPTRKTGKLSAKEDKTAYCTIDDVKQAIGKSDVKFIDARPNSVYTGETAIWMRNGHIPGAINIDWHTLVDAQNPHKFKDINEIQRIFDEKGIKSLDNIIVYCGTSREATLEYAALKHLLSYPNVRLYEGSWTEYCCHSELPVETGNPKN